MFSIRNNETIGCAFNGSLMTFENYKYSIWRILSGLKVRNVLYYSSVFSFLYNEQNKDKGSEIGCVKDRVFLICPISHPK